MRQACLFFTCLLWLSASGRRCGQKEIKERTIEGCTSFEHVRLLGHGAAVWLGEALHNHTDLEFLDLHHTKIGDDDAVAIAEGLKNNDKLRRLAMHNNKITDVGVVAIAEALKSNSALTLLSLSSNAVGDVGAAALGDALRENGALRRLDLYFNLVGDDGAIAIAQALEVNSALRVLHLDNNQLGDPAAIALAKTLRVNQGLAELTLMYNKVRNEGALAVVEAVRESTSVHSLMMGHNRHVIGEASDALTALKDEHLVPRKQLYTWLAQHNLTDEEGGKVFDPSHPDVALERFDHHGPALHSPYAAAAAALKPHTNDGMAKLKELLRADETALHTHEATAHLTHKQRHNFAKLIHEKVAALGHDEL